jgi:hypothetical protein
MKSEVYRLSIPTIGIQIADGETNRVVIPREAILTIVKSNAEDNDSMVECICGRDTVLILAFDLRERGERVTSATTPRD